ncbi:MAG: class I SAM-dependent methyltransferase [Candidatus Electryoneaceae bacterium]|nr:class I SAM-dependent methyltransferase [Candidatus Electryoneaceae bacterium]
MDKTDHINRHDEFAGAYDSSVKAYNSYGAEILFGMCYEYIKPGESLLDLGIGTGLSSVHFAEAGLDVTGLDGSLAMLQECRKKGFAQDLRQFNIQNGPLPYSDNAFCHIVCCGVFHFFGDLFPTINEVSRILKPAGIFAFTIAFNAGNNTGIDSERLPEYRQKPTAWGIPIFFHSDKYIKQILETLGLTIQKEQKLLVDSGGKDADDLLFKVVVVKNTNSHTK